MRSLEPLVSPVTVTTTVWLPADSAFDAHTIRFACFDAANRSTVTGLPSRETWAMPRAEAFVVTKATAVPLNVKVAVALVVDDCSTLPPAAPLTLESDQVSV